MCTPLEIAHATAAYLIGNLALAMGRQGAEFARGLIALRRRGRFFGAAFFLMFPTALRMDGIDLALRAAGWLPSLAPAAARGRAIDP